MSRFIQPCFRVAAVSVASVLLALSAGCSSNGGGGGVAPMKAGPLPMLSASNGASSTGNLSTAGAGNARDLAVAQPESVLGGSRDVDPGGGPATLNLQSLGEMLASMNLQPKQDSNGYTMMVKATVNGLDYTYPITVSFSGDKSYIWIESGLAHVNLKTNNAALLLDMLMVNHKLASQRISIDERGLVILQEGFRNANVSPEWMAYYLKDFFTHLKQLEPYCRALKEDAGGQQAKNTPFD